MHRVTIYTTPTCVYCKMTKEFFKMHSVQYEEKNVLTDIAAREEMVKKSNQMGVPVIDVDGTIVVGFNQEQLGKLLGVAAA
ncbi:MAG: NrdH-redoxin [Candidatus Liptonbacteria bacterium]|nr:NrdH-redoxin [Candidatus Liptonbacteria bacterium]